MYFADLPAMPGCHAWGKTPEDAEENLRCMALAFLESYETHGDGLSPAVKAAETSASTKVAIREVVIAT